LLLAEEYVVRVENCINFHRKQRNVARLFRRIFAYTFKFCEGCDMLLSCCSQKEAVELLRKEAEEDR
jgi:Pyruvate/2-oxoacid:ferredoxin oxidoreductase delta subunit